ncbi:adaptin N terminal region-domain-containing protein [Mycena alexandri]|uniref:Adaptin N terminal region-domain-containing protein n=1 Tax=Mycena alexandri TaxID=1745969 RepID=A0AAD6WYB7_9AGAR|nr:adaptin N terminal region-domain-containing protein [Mycena alexandri]
MLQTLEKPDARRVLHRSAPRQAGYLAVKELATTAEDVIMVTASIMKDMQPNSEAIYRPNAIRAFCRIIDPSMAQGVERFFKAAIVGRNPSIASAALVSAYHLFPHAKDVVKRWSGSYFGATVTGGSFFGGGSQSAAQTVPSSSNITQYHALGQLYLIRQQDRMAVTKMIQQLGGGKSGAGTTLKNAMALCMLIRYAAKVMEEDPNVQRQMIDLLEGWLRHKSDMVNFDAARLTKSIAVMQLFLSPPKPVLKFAATRTLAVLALSHPTSVAVCNVDLESLITDTNRSVATYAITTLLKTATFRSMLQFVSKEFNPWTGKSEWEGLIESQTLKTCEGCGLAATTLKASMCGTCRRLEREELGEEDPNAPGALLRRQKVQRSMGPPLQDVANKPLGLAGSSLAELEALKASSQNGKWTVIVNPFRGATKDKDMGKSTFIIPGETPMQGKEECTLRFSGNIDLDEETKDMSLQAVYCFYQARPDRAVVNNVDAKLKLPKGTSMVFQFHINDKLYNDRILDLEEAEEIVGGKRKKSGQALTGSKRTKTGETAGKLTSSWNPEDDYSSPLSRRQLAPETDKIEFCIVHCQPEGTEGKHIRVMEEEKRFGHIETKPVILSLGDRGKSKDVYKFRIDGDPQPYAAKKVFDIGKGRNVEAFVKLASSRGYDELAEFKVSDGFIILEAFPPPSDDTVEDDNDEDCGFTYLVEPLRSTTVTKFTGTFGASTATDKLTSTVLAFSHYVMQDTACFLAFADLQGSRHNRSLVLFDPMSHTIGGKSGTGDHGAEGIRQTIESHTCNLLCSGLNLSPVDVLLHALEERIEEAANPLVSHSSDG